MPPPTGVVNGPLMATLYERTASSVSFGSHSPYCSLAFSPAGTSNHSIFFLPPKAFLTAASNTRTLARQMSGPVPSPSMKGMIGLSGTTSRPLFLVMAVPVVGAFRIEKFGIRSRPRFGVTRSSQKLWKSLWKTPARSPFAPHQIGSFMRFAPRWCVRCLQTGHYTCQTCTSSLLIHFLPPPPTRCAPPDGPSTPKPAGNPTSWHAISRTRTR